MSFFRRPRTRSEEARERTDIEGLIAALSDKNANRRREALEALDRAADSVGVESLPLLLPAFQREQKKGRVRRKKEDPYANAWQVRDYWDPEGVLGRVIDDVRRRGFKGLEKGMRPKHVLGLMGEPDEKLSGEQYMQMHRVGLMVSGSARKDPWFLQAPHWVYGWRGSSDLKYVLIFKNGRLERYQ